MAVGCFNGQLYIVNTDTQTVETKFQSGGARIISICWHPLFDNLIATGSFDHKIRVHDIKKNTVVELCEHKERVRSILWNSELPWMLISGADDAQVIVWDLRTKRIVTAFNEPTLPMTSLIAHPISPFTLISCHFDSSILFWSLMSMPDVALS